MSVRRWPDVLPYPSVAGFSRTQVDPSVRTDMEVGAQRVRRRSFARLDRISATWKMDPQQYAVFRRWFDGTAVSLAGASDDLSAWTMVTATRSAGATLSPDGVLVDRVLDQATTSVHRVQLALTGAATDGLSVLCRATLRAAGRTKARLFLVDRAVVSNFVDVDLTTGAMTGVTGLTSYSATSRGGGWWRFDWTASTGIGASVPSMRMSMRDDTGALSYLGDITKGVDMCEVQARVVTGYDKFVPSDAAGKALGADAGASWFWTYVPTDTGLIWAEARFASMYEESILSGMNRQISATLEVRYA